MQLQTAETNLWFLRKSQIQRIPWKSANYIDLFDITNPPLYKLIG